MKKIIEVIGVVVIAMAGKNLSEVNSRDTKKSKSFYAMKIENISNFIFA